MDMRPKNDDQLSSKVPSEAGDGDSNWRVDFSDKAIPFWKRSLQSQVFTLSMVLLKLAFITFSLYAFICSLSFLADAFRLLAGRQAGEIFRNSEIFNNPIAGMLVGVLVTVLVQSSSTSTSIVITMVAADLLSVRQAISLIMGANIGTSVTSTIVALAQSTNRDEFRRAFAAATVHDMFNFLSVLVFLPIEAASGYLFHFSGALIDASPIGAANYSASKPPDMLKALTKPFTKQIISLDKGVIKDIATAETAEELAALEGEPILKYFFDWTPETMSDSAAGIIVLISALTILCVTLFAIVWTLKSLLRGRVAVWLHKSVNGDIPNLKLPFISDTAELPLQWLTGYLAIGMGLIITIAVQSSSITTSALTPLVGIGVINIERMYPTVLGANIGTCVTGVLAALAADASKLALTLQVAVAHLLFNISGIVLFYCFWPFRWIPIAAAKFLGDTTAKYRWFALLYLAVCFFLLPAIFMGISLGSYAACIFFALLFVLTIAFVLVVNHMQAKHPEKLPEKLRNWDFLPIWMRSLEPLDRVICSKLTCCDKCQKSDKKANVKITNTDKKSKHASELATAASSLESSAA
jgi:sodium-dependent phosphate cotransporter